MTTPTLRIVDALPTTDVDPIRTLLRGSVLILEAAAAEGLQMPLSVRIDDHAVELTADSQNLLNEWAIWLDADVEVAQVIDGLAIYTVRTTVFEVPVVMQWAEVL